MTTGSLRSLLCTIVGIVAWSALGPSSTVRAQPLADALRARYPTHELVPRACVRADVDVAATFGRICLFDGSSDRVRVVRRVSLGGEVAVERLGDADVYFVPAGDVGVTTRYEGRVWRWDLARDAYLGVARADREIYGPFLARTHEGVIFASGAGLQLRDASASRPVALPWERHELQSQVKIWTHAGITWALARGSNRFELHRLELAGARYVASSVTTIPGEVLVRSDARVVSVAQVARGAFRTFVLDLPSATVTSVDLPAGIRRPRAARLLDGDRVFLEAPRRRHVVVQLGATPSATVVSEAPSTPPLALARSLHVVGADREGRVLVGTSDRVFALGPDGVSTPRRATPARTTCRCEGEAMVCRDGARVESACAEVQELEVIRYDDGDLVAGSTSFSPDGRYRLDRLEPDHARITRLRDGARLWVRAWSTTRWWRRPTTGSSSSRTAPSKHGSSCAKARTCAARRS